MNKNIGLLTVYLSEPGTIIDASDIFLLLGVIILNHEKKKTHSKYTFSFEIKYSVILFTTFHLDYTQKTYGIL